MLIPVYNSGQSLIELYQRLIKVLVKTTDDFELVFVDDASCDDSFAILQKLHAGDERVKIIRLAKNYGQQQALFCGLQFITGGLVITIDDDLQYLPEEIPSLLRKIDEGYDGVFGIPIIKHHSQYRNFGSALINLVLGLISRKPGGIKVSSFRALRGSVVREICQTEKSFIYLAPLIFLATNKVANVFIKHEPRKYGSSGYNLAKLVKLAFKLIWHYSFFGKLLSTTGHPRFEIAEIHL